MKIKKTCEESGRTREAQGSLSRRINLRKRSDSLAVMAFVVLGIEPKAMYLISKKGLYH